MDTPRQPHPPCLKQKDALLFPVWPIYTMFERPSLLPWVVIVF
jgi:hypothetical protein